MTTVQERTKMKKLLITLMLISPFSFADWGDVYYCQMTNFSGITPEGGKENYILEKFQFKLEKDRQETSATNAMVFGQGGFLKFNVMEIVVEGFFSDVAEERWLSGGRYSKGFFNKGKFVFADVGSHGTRSISADCDKLE